MKQQIMASIKKLKALSTIRKTTLILALLTIIAGATEILLQNKPVQEKTKLDLDSVDTVIPYGFVLVPVDLVNQEALTSIISDHAIIDLFSTPSIGQRGGIRVGKRLKLIRAPLNPEKFAVLVTEDEASALMSLAGPFSAVIQNRNQIQIGGLEKSKKMNPTVKAWN